MNDMVQCAKDGTHGSDKVIKAAIYARVSTRAQEYDRQVAQLSTAISRHSSHGQSLSVCKPYCRGARGNMSIPKSRRAFRCLIMCFVQMTTAYLPNTRPKGATTTNAMS